MKDITDIAAIMADIGARARAASSELAFAPSEAKVEALETAADVLWQTREEIIKANTLDLDYGREKGLSDAMMDRLMLDEARIMGMCEGLRKVATHADPVGEVIADWKQPSGLHIQRVRTPLGVIGVIYESRPNVTADAAALCLKAGNAVILRGGSESFHSSSAIHGGLLEGLRAARLPEDAIQLVPTRDRAAVSQMLTMTESIDVIVPRGGKGLVELVQRQARVPVFAHLEGIVHIYLDKQVDTDKALEVVLNAKTRRTGICGAVECLLVHKDVFAKGQAVVDRLMAEGVEVAAEGLAGSRPARESDWGREWLDTVISARVVEDIDAAIEHIRTYGSSHTDCILSEDPKAVEHFFSRVDSAIVMHNASTQFADGGEFGMGAEIGIATGKMHARGPVGAAQLTTFKYLVRGNGTTRP